MYFSMYYFKILPNDIDLFEQEVARQPVTALVDATVEDNTTALMVAADVLISKDILSCWLLFGNK